jgi:hypothetical protein
VIYHRITPLSLPDALPISGEGGDGRDGLLYPGSWSEWEQYSELPVERG